MTLFPIVHDLEDVGAKNSSKKQKTPVQIHHYLENSPLHTLSTRSLCRYIRLRTNTNMWAGMIRQWGVPHDSNESKIMIGRGNLSMPSAGIVDLQLKSVSRSFATNPRTMIRNRGTAVAVEVVFRVTSMVGAQCLVAIMAQTNES